MKSTTIRTTLLLVILMIGASAFAQKERKRDKTEKELVASREQAEGWYLPVHGEVTTDGKKATEVNIKVFKENDELGTFPINKHGAFDLELDLDFVYTLSIEKDGYQTKLIHLDANLPKGLVKYPAYECFVNLEPTDKTASADPFYLDFPSAVVRYNEELGGYYHSEAYLQDINNKLHSVAQARF